MDRTLKTREAFRVFDEQMKGILRKITSNEPFEAWEKTHIAFCIGAVWMRACENVLDALEVDTKVNVVGEEATSERHRLIRETLEGVNRVESPSGRVWLDESAVRDIIERVCFAAHKAEILNALEKL